MIKIHKKCNKLQILLCSRLPLFLMNNGSKVSHSLAQDTASLYSSLLNYTKPLCFYKRGLTRKVMKHTAPSLYLPLSRECWDQWKSSGMWPSTAETVPLKTSKVSSAGTAGNVWRLHLHFLRGFKRNALFQLRTKSVTMVTDRFMLSLPGAK